MRLRRDDYPRIQTARTRRVRLRCNESLRQSTQLRSNVHEEDEADEQDDLNFYEYINYELFLDCTFHNRLENIFRYLNI